MRNASTAIKRVEHDEDRHAMAVTFQSGEVYVYFEVKLSIACDLAWAEQPGKFFQKHIRNRFHSRRVVAPAKAEEQETR